MSKACGERAGEGRASQGMRKILGFVLLVGQILSMQNMKYKTSELNDLPFLP